ncbi:hypothetical protein pdam_00010484 [Pocillopora damicornis]|uniref:Uncharacterized protein n=1 Tax=Pocillopora damicornis TaxID=46731 RepID=A0A3M6V180_POCDA|nr:hypothetical protein pdam_00010484 [Pocillopora damicornis]
MCLVSSKSIFTSASIFKKSEDIKMDMTLFGSVGKKKKETKHFQEVASDVLKVTKCKTEFNNLERCLESEDECCEVEGCMEIIVRRAKLRECSGMKFESSDHK